MTRSAGRPVAAQARDDLARLEATLGHSFENRERLELALTHSSANPGRGIDYERLEFLGDRVLGLCVSEMLYKRFSKAREGELALRLNALVNADALAGVADVMGLHTVIRTGNEVGQLQPGTHKNIKADVVEALIASLYLEGGLDAVRALIERFWAPLAESATAARRDAKTELQEWAHREQLETPKYTPVSRDGPDHAPVFTINVTISGRIAGRGQGPSKRAAEQAAAATVLVEQGIWTETDQNA